MTTDKAQQRRRGRLLCAAAVLAVCLTGCRALPDVEFSWEIGPQEAARCFVAAVADYNNDGLPDLLLGRERPAGFSLWLGNGRGGWWVSSPPFTTSQIRYAAAGDLNNDGWPDVVASTRGDSIGIHVWLNQGDGTWQELRPPVARKDPYGVLVLADLNRDGLLDLVAAGESMARNVGIRAWLGDGAGGFTVAAGLSAPGIFRDLVVKDINGDLIPDVAATPGDETEQGVRVWLSDGYGQWCEVPKPIRRGRFAGLAVGDLNGDGRPDIAAGHRDGWGLAIAFHSDEGKYPTLRPKWLGVEKLVKYGSYWDVEIADLDGDDRNEILASSPGMVGLKIWQHIWCGWQDYEAHPVDFQPSMVRYYGITPTDLNLDGRPDLVVASDNHGASVWMQLDEEWHISWPDRELLPGWPHSEAAALPAEPPRKTEVSPAPSDKPVPKKRRKAAPARGKVKEPQARRIDARARERVARVGGAGSESPVRGDAPKAARWLGPRRPARVGVQKKALKAAPVRKAESEEAHEIEQNEVFTTIDGYPAYRIGPRDELQVSLYVGAITKPPVRAGKKGPEAEGKTARPKEEYRAYKDVKGYPEYVIGPLDMLRIIIYTGLERKMIQLRVRGNGKVFAPDISPEMLGVGGLTPSEVEDLVKNKMKRFIRAPNAEVQVLEYQSKKSSVLGEIRDTLESGTGPGTYALTGMERIVDFIAKHGGPTAKADLTRVQVVGRDGSSKIVNVQRAIFEADESQNIVVRPGDTIFIPSEMAFQRFDYQVVVAGDGTIFLPKVSADRIKAQGLSHRQVETVLVKLLEEREIGQSPKAEVRVVKFSSKYAAAVGEFRDKHDGQSGPGRYVLTGRTTIVDFIAAHGGATERADLEHVQARDAKGKTRVLNLIDAFEGSDMSQNILIDADYVVNIPALSITGRKIYVLGEVKSPGLVAVLQPISLLEGIVRAGNFTPDAVRKRVYVVSGDPAAPGYLLVDVDKIVKGDMSRNVRLVTNDIVYVPRRMTAQIGDVITDVTHILGITTAVRDSSEDLYELKIDPVLRTRTSTERVRVTTPTP